MEMPEFVYTSSEYIQDVVWKICLEMDKQRESGNLRCMRDLIMMMIMMMLALSPISKLN